MNSLRRWLALLLIALTPLPAWSAAWSDTAHCAGPVQTTTHAHTDHGVQADHDAASAHLVGDTTAQDRDGNQHASPCCSAVLPAPTCGAIAASSTYSPLFAPATRFASADRALLKRPPRHSLA